MSKLYLIVGQELKRRSPETLDSLNTQLEEFGLVADPCERERDLREQYTPENIRKKSDPVDTNRYDFVQFKPDDSGPRYIVIGQILDTGENYEGRGALLSFSSASASSANAMDALRQLGQTFPQVNVYAVYADPENVKRQPSR